MDDRSTLERAFENIATNLDGGTDPVTVRLTLDDDDLLKIIRRTQAMLGQMLAEEAIATPWARWKSASRGLVKWWAARLMSALYISPNRNCPPYVHIAPCHVETGTTCPMCGTLV